VAAEVSIAAIKKRGFLDEIASGAKLSGQTLQESIRATKSAIGQSKTFQQGRIIVNTSGNGQSGSFEIGIPGKEITQDNVFAMLQEFLEILRDVITAGGIDSADPAAIDTLYAQMCDDDRLRGIRRQMGDFSGLNFPATSLR
jgi:enoyl reductase-like protein